MERWDEGTQYEDFMGRWSRPVARQFVDWLGVDPNRSWIDVGCGTGALTETVTDMAAPSRLWGVDPSPGFIASAARRLGHRAHLTVGDALSLAFADDEFDVAVSGLALNFIPDAMAAVGEFRRVTKPDGVVAAYVWDYAEGMELIRLFWDVAIGIDPSIAHLDEGSRFPLCRPDALADLFTGAGLAEVDITALVIPTVFTSFDDYWTPMLGGQGPAPSYVMSLNPEDRSLLKAGLRAHLADDEGKVTLMARAWGVKGVN